MTLLLALIEGRSADAGDAIRDRDARQVGAVIEGPFLDAGDAIRDPDANVRVTA